MSFFIYLLNFFCYIYTHYKFKTKMLFKTKVNHLLIFLFAILPTFTMANGVMDRNYTLAHAGMNFLYAFSTLPGFIMLVGFALGILMLINVIVLLYRKTNQNHQVRIGSILTRFFLSGILVSLSLTIAAFGTVIFPSSQQGDAWFKSTASKSLKPANRSAIDKCLNGNQCEQY